MDSLHARSTDHDPRSGRRPGGRLACLLTTLHPERALSNALVQHLGDEMPDIDFTLDASRPNPDVVWVCGYEAGAEELVRKLRLSHPGAFLVVTGRGPTERWARSVHQAGADYACGWPIPVEELARILHRTGRTEAHT